MPRYLWGVAASLFYCVAALAQTGAQTGGIEIKDAWAQQGSGMGGNTPQEFAKFINVEVVKWGKVAKAASITID